MKSEIGGMVENDQRTVPPGAEPLAGIRAALERELPVLRQRFKVKQIGIFGSFIRGEQKETSDLDILVEFEGSVSFFEFLRLERYLSHLLQKKVDLVMKSALKPTIGREILREVIYI